MFLPSFDPSWKSFVRLALHERGGLGVLRWKTRNTIRIPMVHTFAPADSANLDAICRYMARHFEPISLSDVTAALAQQRALSANAITVTVDDACKTFYEYGFPAFHKHRIPAAV